MTFGLAILGIYSQPDPLLYNSAMVHHGRDRRVEISWAACPRWATSASSDLVDVVERLSQEWAVVMIDIQGSGPGGRRLAATLMHMARECLAAGMTAVTSVLAVHQHLFALRQGKVGASIHVCVIDAHSDRAYVAGLGHLGIATSRDGGWNIDRVQTPGGGFTQDAAVQSIDCALALGQQLILANDGITHQQDGLEAMLVSSHGDDVHFESARQFLDEAIARESGRPRSDMAVALISYDEDPVPDDRVLHARLSVPVRNVRSDL